jgi:hypothetical protein
MKLPLCRSSILRKPSILVLTLNLFGGSLGGGLSPTLSISKVFFYGSNTFFQIQKPLSPKIEFHSMYIIHTILNVKDCMGTKFYNKLLQGFIQIQSSTTN